jgi:putative sugar O-methyltransferase
MDDDMTLAWKHIRHPLRTFASARRIAQAEWINRRLLHLGERRFKRDIRYDLSTVTQGFRAHEPFPGPDAALLQRICNAYSLATERQQGADAKYAPTAWWQEHRKLTLEPVLQALRSHDLDALQAMYRNFFRDDCATGLVPVQRIKGGYLDEVITDFHRRLYLFDALFRLDYWKAQTDGRYGLRDLAGPSVGNPFGVMLEDTLVRTGSEYQHYCAHRIAGLLPEGTATVAEIGGGFGGMAYYLLRDRPATTYIDFDVPESIALTSYYLLKAFPQRKIVLYGEAELTGETIAQADMLLMPISGIAELPSGSVDLSFSSHAISDLSPALMAEYLNDIARFTRNYFLYIGNSDSTTVIARAGAGNGRATFTALDRRSSDWNRHIAPKADHVEVLYRMTQAWDALICPDI